MKPHKHAEVIHAFADGAKLQVRLCGAEHWQETRFPDFADECEYRIKPEPAAPKWPQTTMTYEQIEAAAYNAPIGAQWRGIANSALKHACEAGEVVPADKVSEIEAKARAEGIKEGAQQEHERIRLMAQLASPVGGQLVGYQVGNLK